MANIDSGVYAGEVQASCSCGQRGGSLAGVGQDVDIRFNGQMAQDIRRLYVICIYFCALHCNPTTYIKSPPDRTDPVGQFEDITAKPASRESSLECFCNRNEFLHVNGVQIVVEDNIDPCARVALRPTAVPCRRSNRGSLDSPNRVDSLQETWCIVIIVIMFELTRNFGSDALARLFCIRASRGLGTSKTNLVNRRWGRQRVAGAVGVFAGYWC